MSSDCSPQPDDRVAASPPETTNGETVLPLRWRVVALLALACIAVGCPCMRSAVNASPSLRWWLFSNFGAQRMCPEMLKQGAPLKLVPGGNTVGRFFPETCQTIVNDSSQTVTLNFGGTGFAWTPIAGRMGFAAKAVVEYRMDFYMAEDATYVWAKVNRMVSGPEFQIGSVENKVVDWAARSPVGYIGNTFGSQIVQAQLAQGFTVVHTDDGDEFTLGQISPPARPRKAFNLAAGNHYVFANDTTEVHPEQIDILGPYEVHDADQALFLRFMVQGPAIDALVIYRGTGDLWRSGLQLGAALGPPPEAPIATWALPAGVEQRQRLPLRQGQYYVILDNSSRIGPTNPLWSPLGVVGGNAAIVSYAVELGGASDSF